MKTNQHRYSKQDLKDADRILAEAYYRDLALMIGTIVGLVCVLAAVIGWALGGFR